MRYIACMLCACVYVTNGTMIKLTKFILYVIRIRAHHIQNVFPMRDYQEGLFWLIPWPKRFKQFLLPNMHKSFEKFSEKILKQTTIATILVLIISPKLGHFRHCLNLEQRRGNDLVLPRQSFLLLIHRLLQTLLLLLHVLYCNFQCRVFFAPERDFLLCASVQCEPELSNLAG